MVEPPPEDPRECLRVFIVFSGMAGAWRATKELDGRFFGGKKIVSLGSSDADGARVDGHQDQADLILIARHLL